MKPHNLLVRIVLGLTLTAMAGPAFAADGPERSWSRNAWTAEFEAGECRLRTGSDGKGDFVISFQMGGFDGAADYLPIVYSNLPLPLRKDDTYEILIDGRATEFGSEMWFYDGQDAFDRYMVGASLTGGFVPDLVDAFRQGDTVAFQVEPNGKAPYIADDFSLSGFSATYLKISEWCHFDPDNLFRS
ncbi:hypothetical protein [Fulvimarina sp. MAC8]|uniref:hypothetical protein n=1 Tax=Fulvimarina sp. MAC8 TaxID=3162874 RepID=UPI0032EB6280